MLQVDVKHAEFINLIALNIAPQLRLRESAATSARSRHASLHSRAETLEALLSQPQPAAFDSALACGVLLHATADFSGAQPLLVDVGAGYFLELPPATALVTLRRLAAEALSEAALAEHSAKTARADLVSACDSVTALAQLAARGGER